MKTLSTLGRILFGLTMLIFAVNPLMHAQQTAAVIHLPMATPLTYLSGIVFLAGGISLLLNRWTHITMLMIAVLLVVRAFTMHYPNFGADDYAQKMMEIMNMAKDFGLAGAALFMAGLAWPGKTIKN